MPRYRTNFLSQVVLRLDFASVPALQANGQPEFAARVRERFPHLRATQQTQLTFSVGPQGQGVSQSTGAWMWHHASNETLVKSSGLSHDFLSLEYGEGQYRDAAEFLDNFQYIYRAFSEIYRVDTFTRIGWRYVNNIRLAEGNALDWNGIIKPEFISGVMAGCPPGMQRTRSMHQLTASQDDVSLMLNYGLHNPEFPNPIAVRTFLLDLDFFIGGEIRAADVMQRINNLNQRGEHLFESIIDNGLRGIMGVIE